MLAQLASASPPLLLLRLSAVARFVRTRYPIAVATDSGPCVSIHFDRSLRPLLSPPRRNQRLAIHPARPLQSIRDALAEMMPERVIPALRLRHGTRLVGSDADAAALISALADRGCEANLRLVPASDDALQLALGPDWPPTPRPAPVAGPRQCLSFFHFFTDPSPYPTADLPALQHTLRTALTDLGALGTVYLGAEGVNAQLAVPTPRVDDLRATLASLGEPLASVHLNLGDIAEEGSALPFRKLVVRVRPQVNLGAISARSRRDLGAMARRRSDLDARSEAAGCANRSCDPSQVLTDGLDAPLDWGRSGATYSRTYSLTYSLTHLLILTYSLT